MYIIIKLSYGKNKNKNLMDWQVLSMKTYVSDVIEEQVSRRYEKVFR